MKKIVIFFFLFFLPQAVLFARENIVDIRDFGAVEGDTTIVQVKNSVGSDLRFLVDKQTRTGKAIQDAIDFVGRSGGGMILIPQGTWYVYSYIVVKYQNVIITGTGDSTVLKGMPDSPCVHGYGILQVGFFGKEQPKNGFTGICIENLKIDGNIYQRGKPSAEFQMYNLVVYGDKVQIVIKNITSVNSGIDCLMLSFRNNPDCSATVSTSRFKGAFRNTVSVCGGSNIIFTNCTVEDAGIPFGGTNPRYCLDIEPNSPDNNPVDHISFSHCVFRNAINCAMGAVWARDVNFTNCLFETGPDTKQGIISNIACCEITISNSTFNGKNYQYSYIRQEPHYTERFGSKGYLVLENNRFISTGGEIQGHYAVIRNNLFINSGKALFVMAPFAIVENNVLVNCGWADPNGGRWASLCIGYNNDAKRSYIVSNNLVRFDENMLDIDIKTINPSMYFGIYIQNINADIQLINNRAEGFYRFPEIIGKEKNINKYRDWASPNMPPSDIRTETSIISGNSFGGPDWKKETNFK
ncbi:MAG TPA: glycosyl hydrolase family 28-related protein [bacterium]|nr:glycosyl hydrolase family 28-related protein [bacterium]